MTPKTEIALLYLSKHFRQKINLEELAQHAGISPFHFHRLFVEENDCTPRVYLENIRMEHAKHIMRVFPDWSMIDLAFDCGYSSPAIFSRAFKKYFGMAPSKFQAIMVEDILGPMPEQTKPVQVQYFSKKTFLVKKVMLVEEKLNKAYQALTQASPSSNTFWGVFLDAPFHKPPEQCRYFIGIQSEEAVEHSSTLTMPSGYYTSITVQGGFEQLKEKVFLMNEQIKKKGYVMDSLIGYEKLSAPKGNKPFDYKQSSREIFAKIKRV